MKIQEKYFKLLLVGSILLLSSSQFFSQVITFQKKIYNTGHYLDTWNIKHTADGGYIVSGWSTGLTTGLNDACIVKLNQYGDPSWCKGFGNSSTNNTGYSAFQDINGNYLLGGYIAGSPYGEVAFLAKLNLNGDTLWTKYYADQSTYCCTDIQTIIQGSDSDYYFTGFIYGVNGNAVSLVRIDHNNGAIIWSHRYTFPNTAAPTNLKQIKDHGFVIVGYDNMDTFILKTDSAGNISWAKELNGIDYDIFNSVEETSSGKIIAIGTTKSCGTGNYDFLATMFDSLGNTVWMKTFGNAKADEGFSVCKTLDKKFVISGGFTFSSQVFETPSLLVIDSNGTMIAQKCFSSTHGAIRSSDATFLNGYIFTAGTSNDSTLTIKVDSSFGSGCNEIIPTFIAVSQNMPISTPTIITSSNTSLFAAGTNVMIGTAGLGLATFCVNVGMNDKNSEPAISNLFPNPFSTNSTLEIESNSILKDPLFILYNEMGEEVKKIELNSNNQKKISINIDRDHLPSGIYFYQVISGLSILTSGKMIIE